MTARGVARESRIEAASCWCSGQKMRRAVSCRRLRSRQRGLTRFCPCPRFRLPCATSASNARWRMDETAQAAENADKVEILVVDDKAENLLALEAILEGLGQNLVKANSGTEALRQIL